MANDTNLMVNDETLCEVVKIKPLTLQKKNHTAEMKHLSLYIDLAFCVIVLPMMILLFPIERWLHNFPVYIISALVWLYAIYLINRVVTVPCLFGNRHRRLDGVTIIALSVGVTYAFSCVDLYIPKPNDLDIGITRIFPNVQPYRQAIWSLFMIVEAFSFAVGLLTQTNLQRARRREVEAERDRAEIELYKAQIKPHFMFNTLNSLYGLFLTSDELALTSLEKYISMMRYIHISSMRDMVPLKDEADYIRQYVDLQSLRLNEKTAVSLDIDIEDDSIAVPPMLLVTFVENCFKHGVSPVEDSAIKISLHERDRKMEFATTNRIFPVKRIGEHMGIDNCRKRLNLSYPGRHKLEIANDGREFRVELEVRVKREERRENK